MRICSLLPSATEIVAELGPRLRDAEGLREELNRRQALLAPAEGRLHEAERLAREAEALFERTMTASGVTRRLRGLPKPDVQERLVAQRRAAETAARDERDQVSVRLASVREPLLELEGRINEFETEQQASLEAVLQREADARQTAELARATATMSRTRADDFDATLRGRVRDRLDQLEQWQIAGDPISADIEAGIAAIADAVSSAEQKLAGQSLEGLKQEAVVLTGALRVIATELEEIEEALAAVSASERNIHCGMRPMRRSAVVLRLANGEATAILNGASRRQRP